jgi:hypothetical protein
MVEVGNIRILPPRDEWLEPCLLIECEVKTPPKQCIIEIKGVLLTEDGKIISVLEEAPSFIADIKEVDNLVASENIEYKKLSENISKFHFTAPLSRYAIEHIERLREKRPKRDVELRLRFVSKYLVSNVCTSHLYEVPPDSLPPGLKVEFKKIKGRRGEYPDSLIVYEYDPEFKTSRMNMWILSADSGPKFLSFFKEEKEYSYRVHIDDWIHDFLPKLKAYTVMTIEVPTGKPVAPIYEHLAKATEELKLGEEYLREGKHDSVIRSVRNIIINHLLTKKEEVEVEGRKQLQRFLDEKLKETIIANIPKESEKEYRVILDGIQGILRRLLQDHLSKFMHIDTSELIRMPLKEDAEYLFLAVANIVKYLSKLSLPPQK